MDSIYDIIHRLRGLEENIGAEQRKVKQLPALFKPAQTSPQISGPYPGRNATRGYLVGEGEEEIEEGDVVPLSKAGMNSVVDQKDYTEKRDKIYRLLSQPGVDPETKTTAKELLKKLELAAKNAGLKESLRAGEYHLATVTLDDGTTQKIRLTSDEGYREQLDKHFSKQGKKITDIDIDYAVRSDIGEDVISTVKKKLGDYLQDVATAIKTDPDLKDKIPQTIDQLKAVKTIQTDDGKEIKITGNEDDGFRVSIQNREIKTPFKNLDEATMACEMYCAHRRDRMSRADYIEEKRP